MNTGIQRGQFLSAKKFPDRFKMYLKGESAAPTWLLPVDIAGDSR